MPSKWDKMPNSGRWYRKDYTDWVHHWWDIDSNFWDNIIALDDAIIVRIVNGFEYSDLNSIKRGASLTNNDKIKNLDILRWNQVWLKTMQWDVVMYSHLDEVYSNLEVGDFVRKWEPIWTVWISGIPDKTYKDYHLHFVVHINPYDLEKGDSYDNDDYMKWDWLFKWKSQDYILDNWNKYFVG